MKYLFDTDHISILQRRTGTSFGKLAARIAQESPANLTYSVVSFHEQLLGCHTYIIKARNSQSLARGYAMLAQVLRDFLGTSVLEFDNAAAGILDVLIARRIRIGRMDLRIAAIALSRGLTLLTRNSADFGRIPGLTIEDWTA